MEKAEMEGLIKGYMITEWKNERFL